MKKILVVIPVLNDCARINDLSRSLSAELAGAGMDYRIVCFDKESTGGTAKHLQSLLLSNSLTTSDADYIAIIDPELPPPGKVTSELLNHISDGQDILYTSPGVLVLKSGVLAHLLSVGKHQEQIFLWSLIQHARHLGYEVADYPIEGAVPIKKRSRLSTKWLNTRLAFTNFPPYRLPPESQKTMKWAGVHYRKTRFITHTTIPHEHSAVITLTDLQKLVLLDLGIWLASCFLLNWHLTLLILFSLIVILYFADLLFNVLLIFRSLITNPEVIVSDKEIQNLVEEELPLITILCPLYKEESILPQFIQAMSSFDYPKNKLQVLLLLEEDDKGTIEVAKKLSPPAFVTTLLVPNSLPRTKPKALNWGLGHAKGEYLVIYDAEDIPEKDQLKKAIVAFDRLGKDVFCLQAKLNFYNPKQNILTRLFTTEYSLWFDLILTGLYSIGAPIPLGGTSNFFRTKDISDVEGWDAFNVCEDCDLGLRLYKRGHNTALFNSTTHEEANSNLNSWIKQRSHWIKGYIQGFFVHIRSPKGFMRSIKEPHFFTFLLIVGGKTLSVFINPFLWLITISYFLFRPILGPFIESFYPAPIFYIGLFTLLVGNFIYMYNYMLGSARRGNWHLVEVSYLVPFYWLLMSFAAWKALYQIIVKPYYWEKTTHGLHLNKINT